jgi:hypothetical protein
MISAPAKEGFMKPPIYPILFVGLLCVQVHAQRVEIFGGAQYKHLESSYNAVGWNASLTGTFKHVLGITGDFGGVYKNRRTSLVSRGFPAEGAPTVRLQCSLAAVWILACGKVSGSALCRQIG